MSFFVMRQNMVDGQWDSYDAEVSKYKAYMNPTILSDISNLTADWEKCPSLPHVEAKVDRMQEILIEYMNEEADYVTDTLEGFEARVYQHEVDHCWGFLISSFTVCEGNLRFPSRFTKSVGVTETYKIKATEAKNRLEQRLLVDKKFKEEAEETQDTKGFIMRRVLDDEFESEFSSDLYEALLADIRSPPRK